MNTIKFITYLFYKYYSTGATASVAYTKTITSMVLFIFIHVCILLILVGRTDLLPTLTMDTKGIRYLKVAIITLPGFLFFLLFIKEKNLKLAAYDEEKVRKSGYALLIYLILILLLLFSLIIFFPR